MSNSVPTAYRITAEDRPRVDISVIVPVYKEEENIQPFLRRTVPILEALGSYEVIFCLDPSPDRTEQIIVEEAASNPNIGLLVFSRRFGQPAATIAGLHHCVGDSCVVIDVDLQDPPELISEMYAKSKEGFDVVYAVRSSREGETFVKNVISAFGYRLINRVTDVAIPRDTGDFRLLTRKVIDELSALKEGHGFLRGLVAFVGFPQTAIYYDRQARAAGKTKYNPLTGSFKIAFNGLFGFSTVPLSFLMWFGVIVAMLSLVAIVLTMVLKLVFQQDFPLGVPTITIAVLFMGGVEMFAIGVIGEYTGRIYDEVRDRPQYIVHHAVNLGAKRSTQALSSERTQ